MDVTFPTHLFAFADLYLGCSLALESLCECVNGEFIIISSSKSSMKVKSPISLFTSILFKISRSSQWGSRGSLSIGMSP
jgi:hypothetical protein